MSQVSVIIPTRNRPQLVCIAVRSVLRQTLRDIEVIVVIDGPDVESQAALQSLGDERVRVISLEESVGGCEARNIGIRAAASPWVALLDDDDEWLTNKLERQLSLAPADADPESLYLAVSRFIVRTPHAADMVWPIRFPRPGEHISEYLFCTSRNVFQTSTFLCTRALMLKVPFTTGLRRLQDWDWLLRAMALPGVQLLTAPEALSVYALGMHATISKTYDWDASLQWGQSCRHLMTPRGYRGFIAKKCAADAAQKNAALGDVWMLFKESAAGCGWRVREPLMFIFYYLLSPSRRHALGDRLFGWRKVKSGAKSSCFPLTDL
jgi:glycosyltransferase involved in cell wall biosynthesis